MNLVLLVSRWFYPWGTPLPVWLSLLALLAAILLPAAWRFRGTANRVLAGAAMAAAAAGAVISVGMMAVEVALFELGSPLCTAAYVVLFLVFVWFLCQRRWHRARLAHHLAVMMLTGAALVYLFLFGAIPRIVEISHGAAADLEGANAIGRHDGTLLIAEFADFECPPCAVQDRVMDELWAEYADSIRYSFRHLPRPRHSLAQPAALASQCAAEQGRFWETKRLLFANQHRLAEILASPQLPTIPAEGAARYTQCVQSQQPVAQVRADAALAGKLGVRGTPSIVIGNYLIHGVTSFPRLSFIIGRELAARNLPPARRASRNKPSGCDSSPGQACSESQEK